MRRATVGGIVSKRAPATKRPNPRLRSVLHRRGEAGQLPELAHILCWGEAGGQLRGPSQGVNRGLRFESDQGRPAGKHPARSAVTCARIERSDIHALSSAASICGRAPLHHAIPACMPRRPARKSIPPQKGTKAASMWPRPLPAATAPSAAVRHRRSREKCGARFSRNVAPRWALGAWIRPVFAGSRLYRFTANRDL